MKPWSLALILIFAAECRAYDGVTSELSHAFSGAVLAGAVTRKYRESEHRAWIGFAASTVVIVAVEGHAISRGSDRSSQLLDISAHAIGAAAGAWFTDRYLLLPVVGKSRVGILFQVQY
jgi:hypothetical protein